MAGLLHGCARTTPRVRAELKASQESTRALAARYGLNPKTVAKWKKRTTTADAPMGPRAPHSSVLTPVEEALAVHIRCVAQLVESGGQQNYEDAVRLVSRIGALRQSLGEAAEQAAYVAGLKTRYKAKRNFMKLFAA